MDEKKEKKRKIQASKARFVVVHVFSFFRA